MKNRFLSMVLTTIAAAPLSAEMLEPGIWMLEVYRPDAPQDTIQLDITINGGSYKVTEGGAGQQFDNFRISEGTLWFEHLDFEESCRLLPRPQAKTWQGTCPPDNEPKFEDGLTITLRRPRGHVPHATVAEADTSADVPEEDAQAEDELDELSEEALQVDSSDD
jgi:hypothetical protein